MRKGKKKNKFVNALINGAISAVVTFVVGIIAINYFFGVELIRPYVVQSGSMEPAIKTGSVVFSLPSSNYNPGDIITFAPEGNAETLITHRIEFKLYPEGDFGYPLYLTSGDANKDFDRWEVWPDDIVGKVIFTIPYVGYTVNFAKQPYGFILLVIIPATIVIYEELKMLARELILFLKRVKEEVHIRSFFPKRQKNPTEGEVAREYVEIVEKTINLAPKKQSVGIHKASILIPVIGAALVLVSLSVAYFFDIETSIDNVLGVAESFDP